MESSQNASDSVSIASSHNLNLISTINETEGPEMGENPSESQALFPAVHNESRGLMRRRSTSVEELYNDVEDRRKRQHVEEGTRTELERDELFDVNLDELAEVRAQTNNNDIVDLSCPTQLNVQDLDGQNNDNEINVQQGQAVGPEDVEEIEQSFSASQEIEPEILVVEQVADPRELINVETLNGDEESEATGRNDHVIDEEVEEESDADGDGDDFRVLSEEEQIRAQQVIEIEDDEQPKDVSEMPIEFKRASEYVCPICMEPPEASLMTNCGHIFCTTCLYGMVNSSRGHGRRNGICALCRKDVRLQDVRMIILKKKRIKKTS